VLASILVKPCSSNYARFSKLQEDAENCESGWQLSISVDGKDDAPGIKDSARTSSICSVVLSSIISKFRLVLSCFMQGFKIQLELLDRCS